MAQIMNLALTILHYNMKYDLNQKVQKSHTYAIVEDQVDSMPKIRHAAPLIIYTSTG